ncbi:GPI anchored serine-threonine rich family protein [Aspergillus saccharolyticus JOP 1030-1]|uniref:Yeast cell wall synthesis Kre9/Knh1-like N-terminal domain-containing protein n=1 Tax=Aspergillus saccharolyticus JOP 1030-1 TaxID=1450539 RepID=A0A318Z6T9_9EURO|nr:hypothetical protein BP01DRAFT_122564 [Aspergillus saccharolyticus JOP 1030-1]PYH43015.1 hypothetical protein BP01DRAFT_122564 [Aspergillus saccharolyticus JOP 1030-1]
MRLSTPALLVSLTSLASAISITQPGLNATYAAGSTVTVDWTSVDTDPSSFSLYLWNFVSWPPTYVPLALDIPTADLTHRVQIPCDTDAEWGYQISGINGTNVYIIYAQSEKFTVTPPVQNCSDAASSSATVLPPPSRTPAAPTCAAPATQTVYVTVSPTGSSSVSHHQHHHHSHHFHHHDPSSASHVLPAATPAIPAVVVPVVTSKTVKPGIVPKTIGWCSDYSHPVTLKIVPTPTAAIVEVSSGVTTVAVTAAPSAGGEDAVVVTSVTTTVSVAGEGCAFA